MQRPRPNRRERRGSAAQDRRTAVPGRRAPQPATRPAGGRFPAGVGIVVIAIAAIAVLALLALVIRDTINRSGDPSEDASASLPGTYYEPLGRDHLQPGQQYDRYNSNPPTSGPHAPSAADWGVHQDLVPKEQLVHNLEHGGVLVLYNCPQACDDISKPLADFVQQQARDGHYVLLAPYPGMEHKIALVAWTRLDAFDAPDLARVERFVDVHRCRFDPEHICK